VKTTTTKFAYCERSTEDAIYQSIHRRISNSIAGVTEPVLPASGSTAQS
jgi:hypothetical protein